ncbi:MAG: cytochrome c3 family protein [Candidatus Eisenbacteria bacterium]
MNESPRHPGLAPAAIRTNRLRTLASLLCALGIGLPFGFLAAQPSLRPPRNPATLEALMASGPHTTECERCHTAHGGSQVTVYPNALVGPDDNSLCQGCHNVPWQGGSYATNPLYLGTSHGSRTSMIWPGPTPPARIEADAATKCLNCHDPHGWTDALGAIPSLLLQREEATCLACHDGSPATINVRTDLLKAYRHPVTDYTGRHTGPKESLPADFATTPVAKRHSECADCHNAHVSRGDGVAPSGTAMSKQNLGVSRVAVVNGLAGSRPLYQFVAGSDTLTTPNAEYQLCFKCHSTWTTQPTGQTDFATVLNPANPSFHPVESVGRNTNIRSGSFVIGWSATSITRCGSCHGSDFGTVDGPHGSSYQYLLKKPYTASAARRTMSSTEICFTCHDWNVYANNSSSNTVKAYSRFNPSAESNGHTYHVSSQRVSCYSCHITHGSTSKSFLIVTGRNPGINTFTQTTNGGTCAPTCHGSESYTVNYAR